MDRADEIRDDYYEHADEWHADRIERRERSGETPRKDDVVDIGDMNQTRDRARSGNEDKVHKVP